MGGMAGSSPAHHRLEADTDFSNELAAVIGRQPPCRAQTVDEGTASGDVSIWTG